jgi:c-di-GMP-binding flagellar brake protein YcgR
MMDERRRYERVNWYHPLKVTVLPDGPSVQASSFDISLGGVGVTVPVMLERGQPVCVRFHFATESPGGIDEDVLGRVAYANADEDGNRIGVEFLEPIRENTKPMLAKKLSSL